MTPSSSEEMLNSRLFFSLRSRMLLVFGGTTILILLTICQVYLFGIPFTGIQGEYARQSLKALSALQDIADQHEMQLSAWFNERIGDLKSLAVNPLLEDAARPGTPKSRQSRQLVRYLQQIKAAYGYESIDIFDAATGLCIVSTDTAVAGRPHPLAERLSITDNEPWDQKAFFVKKTDGDHLSLILARLIHSNEQKAGTAVVLRVSTEKLTMTARNAERELGSSGEIILMGLDKTILTPLRHSLPDGATGRPLEYKLKTLSADYASWGVDSLLESRDYRNVPVVSAIRHLRFTPDFALSMIVKRDKSELNAPVKRSILLYSGISGIGILCTLIFVSVFARKLSKPLVQLTRAAQMIRDGNLNARAAENEESEIGRLASVFNEMAARIQREQEHLEQLVAERTENYQTLFREMTVGFALHQIICSEQGDPVDYRFIAVNQAFETMTGLKAEDVVGRTVLEIMPDTEKFWIETYGNVARTGVPTQFESYASVLNKYFEVKAFRPLEGQFACITTDITLRKQTEEKLRNLNQRLSLATESACLGVWDWNVRDNTMAWDDRMYEFYGVTRDDLALTVEVWKNGLHPDDRERAIAECQAALKGDAAFDTVFRVVSPDGTVRHIKANGKVIFDSDGSPVRMIGVNADLTEKVRADEEKSLLEGRLQQSQKLESIGRLAGGVAHDFNNKLMVILGNADLAKIDIDHPEKITEYLDEITLAAEHSREITSQLLAFSRKQVVAPRLLNANRVIEEGKKSLKRLIGEHITFEFSDSADLWNILMDPVQLDQIIMNLAVNAADAMPDGGVFSITTANVTLDGETCSKIGECVPGEYVRISFSDTGCGIDPEIMEHIFEPFFTTKDVGKGTGLGLATIYGIVSQNNGFITVGNRPEHGAEFEVFLPRYTETPENRMSAPHKAMTGKGSILLVEDEPSLCRMVSLFLSKLGYDVHAEESPLKALETASDLTVEIDLVLTDMVMPEMSGRNLIDMIRLMRPDIKVVFTSGYTSENLLTLDKIGSDAVFIQKPYDLNRLSQTLQELLAKSG